MNIRIACIVEGQGDEAAVPVLLRRMVWDQIGYENQLKIPRPVRVHRHKIVRRAQGDIAVNVPELNRAAELAARKIADGGLVDTNILCTILDADEDLPCEVAPPVLRELEQSQQHLKCSVVFPRHEFEAWFIAASDSLRSLGLLLPDVISPADPEAISNAKGWLSKAMGRTYAETVDQQKFASQFDLSAARRARSFDKLWRDINRILTT